jgi:alpha-tubulin suppressor-like RCC1 family protein
MNSSSVCRPRLLNCFTLTFLLGLAVPAPQASAGSRVVAWGAGTIIKTSDNNDFGQSIVPATLTNAVLVAGGWRHSLALKVDGTLKGWGDDTLGQTDFPVRTNYVAIYEAISCGYLFSLALQTNGTVVAAGDDAFGQTAVPSNLSNVVAIACGFYHSLALKADGKVVAWGPSTNAASIGIDPDYGQTLIPSGLSNVVAIAGGGWHSLALKADGTLTGWGRNDYLQASIPPEASNAVAIAAGAAHSLILKANGKLVAWGDNTYGQTNIPSSLTNGLVVAIAAGGWHNLALKSDGTVVAWGAGIGSNVNVDYKQNNVPTGLSNVVQIAAGMLHSLALVESSPPIMEAPLTVNGFGTNGFTMGLPTRNGRVYQLEYSSFLDTSGWSKFPLQAGLGGTMLFVDPTLTATQRFYRVSQW